MPIYRKGIQYRDPEETFFGIAQSARQSSENCELRRKCLARMQADKYNNSLVLPIIDEMREIETSESFSKIAQKSINNQLDPADVNQLDTASDSESSS